MGGQTNFLNFINVTFSYFGYINNICLGNNKTNNTKFYFGELKKRVSGKDQCGLH